MTVLCVHLINKSSDIEKIEADSILTDARASRSLYTVWQTFLLSCQKLNNNNSRRWISFSVGRNGLGFGAVSDTNSHDVRAEQGQYAL